MLINTNVEKMLLGTKPDGSPIQAFIVDDSAFMVKTIQRMLESFGSVIAGSAGDGDDAIKKVGEMAPKIDLITLDISMPKKDGLAALPELIKLNPRIKIVMVSALGDKDKVKQAIMSGAKHFVVKPFKQEKVFDIIRWVMEKD
jgi:two-component system chemotaxis response regulator CheY